MLDGQLPGLGEASCHDIPDELASLLSSQGEVTQIERLVLGTGVILAALQTQGFIHLELDNVAHKISATMTVMHALKLLELT